MKKFYVDFITNSFVDCVIVDAISKRRAARKVIQRYKGAVEIKKVERV